MEIWMMKTAITLLMLAQLKTFFLGGEFSIPKWIKEGKSYIEKYNEWKEKAP